MDIISTDLNLDSGINPKIIGSLLLAGAISMIVSLFCPWYGLENAFQFMLSGIFNGLFILILAIAEIPFGIAFFLANEKIINTNKKINALIIAMIGLIGIFMAFLFMLAAFSLTIGSTIAMIGSIACLLGGILIFF